MQRFLEKEHPHLEATTWPWIREWDKRTIDPRFLANYAKVPERKEVNLQDIYEHNKYHSPDYKPGVLNMSEVKEND